MELSAQQQSILGGAAGHWPQRLMAVLVDLGEAGDAKALIPIAGAHVAGVSYLTGKDGLRTFLSSLAEAGVRASVPASTNPCGMDREQWEQCGTDPTFAARQGEILRAYETLGIALTLSCTPYQIGITPALGTSVAWSESSAIVIVNSYFGARTNRESGLSSLASAVHGLTPDFGLHRTDERRPNLRVRISVKDPEATALSLLGEGCKGLLTSGDWPNGPIPYIEGLPPLPLPAFKALSAPLGTHGCALAHVEGTTPEAKAMAAAAPREFTELGPAELKALADSYAPTTAPDLVVLGCPQQSLEEVAQAVALLRGRKVRKGMDLWLFTSALVAATASSSGLVQKLRSSGARLLADTCPEVIAYPRGRYHSVLTDSMKAVEYIRSKDLSNLPCGVLPTASCIDVAVGELEVG